MATELLRPDGQGFYNSGDIGIGAPAGGEAKWEDIDEAVADDLTSYLFCGAGTEVFDSYTLTASALTTETINSVRVYFRISSSAASLQKARPCLRLADTDNDGTQVDTPGDGSWATNSEIIGRPGGGGWTVADLANLEVRIGLASPNAGVCQLTQLYVEVDYTAAGGGGEVQRNAIFHGTNF